MARARTADRRSEIQAELDVPPAPVGVGYLLEIFDQLAARRPNTSCGPALLPWSEIDAWQRVTGRRLTAWEASMIVMLDEIQVAEIYRAMKDENG